MTPMLMKRSYAYAQSLASALFLEKERLALVSTFEPSQWRQKVCRKVF